MKDSKKLDDNFETIANWLVSRGSIFSPSELHGALNGALSGGMRLEPRQWAMFMLAVMGIDQQVVDEDEDIVEQLNDFAQNQLKLLQSDSLDFQLALPDDDYSVQERTDATSRWCKGFLGGFAEAQVFLDKQGNELEDNVLEALRDMSSIAQASLSAEEEYDAEGELDDALEQDLLGEDEQQMTSADMELTAEELEEAERDYFEVVEYLRLAALTVFTEHGWVEVEDIKQELKQSPQKQSLGAAIEKTQKNTLH